MQRKGKSNLDSASNHSINSVVPTAPNTDDLDTSTLNAWTQKPWQSSFSDRTQIPQHQKRNPQP